MGTVALILVDHGSRRDDANAALDVVVADIAAKRPGLVVRGAHMEIAKPDLATVALKLIRDGVRSIVVHPFFLAPGRHATQDLPAAVARLAHEHPTIDFRCTEPLGPHAGLADIVLERAGLPGDAAAAPNTREA